MLLKKVVIERASSGDVAIEGKKAKMPMKESENVVLEFIISELLSFTEEVRIKI